MLSGLTPARAAAIGAVLVVIVAAGWWGLQRLTESNHNDSAADRTADPAAVPDPTFVGAAACATCHTIETERWRQSMHARAMEAPSRTSVEAPFAGERFVLRGASSVFSERDGAFVVRTDGPDGVAADFPVAYTFGIAPLQQYLLSLPGGRLQAFTVAWDARPAPRGRRWFHLYPDAPARAGDVQHWTSPSQNWNAMCADCHSTNLRKGYVEAENRYATTWTDVNVACEACHGAGSRHVAWARGRDASRPASSGEDTGLARLAAHDGAAWMFDPATGIAHRDRPRTSRAEVETCARCHARRAQLTDDYRAGQPLADTHRPVWLEDDLYFADGQIKDEVYEYGSFLQSRMYANGVTCSDCHDPHRPEILSSPDEVCARCHLPSRFSAPAHHHHATDSAGASCVACHMPSRTYMTVDDRRDHSFRVPRPDLTDRIGTPNACGGCHKNRPAAWAADRVAAWRGTDRPLPSHYGEAIAAGRSGAADAEPRLLAVVGDQAVPAIARATAIALLPRWLDAASLAAIERALGDADPLVRLAAADVLSQLPDQERTPRLAPLLADPVRSVRIQAARALASAPIAALAPADLERRTRGIAEWEAVQHFNGDSASAHVNLGVYFVERGEIDRARQAYETARRLEPFFAPAAVNLADLYRAEGRDTDGERVLREALTLTPDVSSLHYSLGLLLARRKDLPAAVAELTRAAALAPGDANMQYGLAVALYAAGRQKAAIDLLDRTWRGSPGDRAVLAALVSYVREQGDLERAESLAGSLVAISPGDPRATALLAEIRRDRGK